MAYNVTNPDTQQVGLTNLVGGVEDDGLWSEGCKLLTSGVGLLALAAHRSHPEWPGAKAHLHHRALNQARSLSRCLPG